MAEAKLAAIDAQIAKLQEARERAFAQVETERRAREKEEANILVRATPTKASIKEQAKAEPLPERSAQPIFAPASSIPKPPLCRPLSSSSHPLGKGPSQKTSLAPKTKPLPQSLPTLPAIAASRLKDGLARLRQKGAPVSVDSAPRSTSLAQVPAPVVSAYRPSSSPALSPGARHQASCSRSASLEVAMESEEGEPNGKEKSVGRGKKSLLSVTTPLESYQDRSRRLELSRAPEWREQTQLEKAKEAEKWREMDKLREKARLLDLKKKNEEEDERRGVKREEQPTREDDMTVIERLRTGPRKVGKDAEGGDEWSYVEPNSGIRLRERSLAHVDLQEHLYGRYYLAPSKLYSVIRLSRDKSTYDVPVDGDWVTIAVVAQRSEIRTTGTKDTAKVSDDDGGDDGEDGTGVERNVKPAKGKGKGKAGGSDDWKKRVPRKYVNLTLSAMPQRRSDGSASGDSLLQLLLFEADSSVQIEDDEGNITKEYRGGSGGAYEKWCNLATGSVIAIMNPRVWRNLRGGAHTPHPLEFPLGLNPTSADSIALIGLARDLGRCIAIQRDGNRCRSWVDTRQSKVCEYHIHMAVKSGRSKRAEFTASTSSMSLMSSRAPSTGKDGKPNPDVYNPRNKTGLLPRNGPRASPRGLDNGGGGATYIVGGRVLNTGSGSKPTPFAPDFLGEKMGRHAGWKRRRDVESKAVDLEMARLVERDSGFGGGTTGGKYLATVSKNGEKKGAGPTKGSEKNDEEVRKRSAFSVDAVRKLGFDPARRPGQKNEEDEGRRTSLAALRDRVQEDKLEISERRKQEKRQAAKRARLEGNSKPAEPRQDAIRGAEKPAPASRKEMEWWSQGEAGRESAGGERQELKEEGCRELRAERPGEPPGKGERDLMEEVGEEWMDDVAQGWREEQDLVDRGGQDWMEEQGQLGEMDMDQESMEEDKGLREEEDRQSGGENDRKAVEEGNQGLIEPTEGDDGGEVEEDMIDLDD